MNNGTTPTPSFQTPEKIEPHANAEKSVIDANNRFALNFFSNLCKDAKYSGKTLFFSPFSISSAFAITFEGARESTAEEIQTVFRFPNDSNQRRMEYKHLYEKINQENSGYLLKTATALWAEKTYLFLPEFVNLAQLYYNANATNLDFQNQPDISSDTINRWVEDQTNNTIMNLFSKRAITKRTRLVITNAVYFKGTWIKSFGKMNETRDDVFYITQKKTVPVKMMENTDEFTYTETDDLQVLEMGYDYIKGSGRISMLILLPKTHTLASIEESLTVQKLSDIRKSLELERVNVYFPKFKLETRYGLFSTLASMGMPTAFTGKADFSGMDGLKNLFIGEVIHQAFVEVNEEGTEAVAVTYLAPTSALGGSERPKPIPTFRADHPFIFFIQDRGNGNILFMGRVNNPNG